MNALVFLVTTTPFLAGAEPVPGPAMAKPAAPAPVMAAPVASPCNNCGGCSSGCNDCCGHVSLLDRIRARLHAHDCCDTCNTCAAPVSSCGDCCDSGCGLLARLRARFSWHHCDSCCETASSCCGSAPLPGAPAPRAEPIPAPKDLKKMPSDTKKPAASLNLEPAPKANLSLDTESRSPFDLGGK